MQRTQRTRSSATEPKQATTTTTTTATATTAPRQTRGQKESGGAVTIRDDDDGDDDGRGGGGGRAARKLRQNSSLQRISAQFQALSLKAPLTHQRDWVHQAPRVQAAGAHVASASDAGCILRVTNG